MKERQSVQKLNQNQSKPGKPEKLTSKFYFWLALAIPGLTALVSAALILHLGPSLSFCFSKECQKFFIDNFNIPISLAGLTFITTGAAFAYYRIQLGYEQNERQLSQFVHANYNTFRNEFLIFFEEREYKYTCLDIHHNSLFNAFYPQARQGDLTLNSDVVDFITCDEHHLGFVGAMNRLRELIVSKDVEKYRATSYQPIANLFIEVRELIEVDAALQLSPDPTKSTFTGVFARCTRHVAEDVFFIINTLNAFEGFKFYQNSQSRLWRNAIECLSFLEGESQAIENFISEDIWKSCLNSLCKGDVVEFKVRNLWGNLPENLRNNQVAREYIYHLYTTGQFKSLLSSEASKALREALHL